MKQIRLVTIVTDSDRNKAAYEAYLLNNKPFVRILLSDKISHYSIRI